MVYEKELDMVGLIARQKQALKLVEKIVELDPDAGTVAYAKKMQERLKLPMAMVLEKLWPEDSIAEKARKLGVTRQAYYGWINGYFRPDGNTAKMIAKATGFDESEIRGHFLIRRR